MVRLKTGTAINPFAYTAKTATQGLISAATGDLAVIRTQTRPRGRHAPIEYELHLNPAALGIAAVGAGLTMWLLQLKLGHKKTPVLLTHQVEADLPLNYTIADIDSKMPVGYDWTVAAPDQPFILAVAGVVILGLIGLQSPVPANTFIKYTEGEYMVKAIWGVKYHEAIGHNEQVPTGTGIITGHGLGYSAGAFTSVWVVDVPAWTEDVIVSYHLSGKCYKWDETTTFEVGDRKGFSLAGPWP